MGRSGKMTSDEQAKAFGNAWERLPAPRPQVSLQIIDPDPSEKRYFNLGPHPPRLWPEDIDLLHRLWLELSEKGPGHKLHHRDVVRVALQRLDVQLHSSEASAVMRDVVAETAAEHGKTIDAEADEPGIASSSMPPDPTSRGY